MHRTIAAALTVMTILLARPHQASAGYCFALSGGSTRVWEAPDLASRAKIVRLASTEDGGPLSSENVGQFPFFGGESWKVIGYYSSTINGVVKYDKVDSMSFVGWAEIVYGPGRQLWGFVKVRSLASQAQPSPLNIFDVSLGCMTGPF